METANEQMHPQVVGPYILYDEISRGGMATVRFGRRLSNGERQTVAVKCLHPQYARDLEFVTMFQDEARIASSVRHPNVVPLLEVVRTDEELYIVMEYIRGDSLSRLLYRCGKKKIRIPMPIISSIMANVLYGLDAAHEALDQRGVPLRVVHRDVSPPNILVGADGVARVVDFGIAKAAGRMHTTGAGEVKGKLWYISPEQAITGQVDRRTDIYSASVVLWECLTGQRLFEGDRDHEILEKVVAGAAMPPSGIVPTISEAFDRITMRGLNKDPNKRWSSAKEMGLALRAIGPVATPEEVGRWVQELAKGTLEKRDEALAYILQLEEYKEAEEQAVIEAAEGIEAAENELKKAVGTSRRFHSGKLAIVVIGIASVVVAIAMGFVLLRGQAARDTGGGTTTGSR